MRESKAESIKRVAKLVEKVHECEQAMAAAGNPMHEKVEQFGFELRTELGRLGGGEVSGLNLGTAASDPGAAIESALDHYRQALNSNVPAHTRAMLIRQSEVLNSLKRAA